MSKKVTYIKTSSLTRKIGQLAAAIVLLAAAITIWLNVSVQGKNLVSENSLVLADNILLQTSHSAQVYIESGDIASLNHLTDSALKSDYILEMVIYDEKGVVLSKSNNAITTRARFITDLNKDIQPYDPAPFVKEIRNDKNELLGFVRLTMLKKNLQQSGASYISEISQQILFLMFVTGVIGYLLTIGLRPFSSNAYYVKD
ncbi:MAG: hypothetical protein HWE10_01745 [Gammaproteobacteria bacterium]|nr:hypothetical protein [Gammaproteobacteria bacterium]